MPAKVRVYELARELGMENSEILELCDALGIEAKSHSSSIVDAQGDRVRRKAHREGLVREPEPEPEPEPVAEEPVAEPEAEPEPTAAEPEPVAAEPEPEPAPKVVRSSGSAHPPRPEPEVAEPAPVEAASPAPAEPEQAPAAPDAPAAAGAAEATAEAAETPPVSSSGKPIPPPPPPTSVSGKPIPPPPGGGGRGGPSSGAPRGRPGGPGAGAGAGGAGGPGGPGGPRPSGPPRGRPPSRGGPRQSVPGAGGRPGGGPGRGQQRPPRRRKSRRRRIREELQPMDASTYTPTEAPVPEGEMVVERATSAQDLGPKLNRTAADVVRFLMQQGEMVTATQSLSDDMIELFAADIGAEVRLVDPGEEQEVELKKKLDLPDEEEADTEQRPPVVTVMGHVDHGKTLLLDRIREANVADGEAGGITQHIGAYRVDRGDHSVAFIDTPGHEAFTAMRARGAEATDIVVLVVAADDGVMPQTVEALNHAKAAEVPIVVAINKIDRENADPNRVLQQLSEHELVPESWGGDTVTVEVSAKTGDGIDDLLDNLSVVAEVEDLQARAEGRATGVVLESHLDTGRGPVATVMVKQGTLRVGDPMVAGAAWGRVRALIDDHGRQVKEAGPSTPVEVLGLSDVAEAGDEFVVGPDEKVARNVADKREHFHRQATLGRDAHAMSGGAKLEDIFEQIQAGEAAMLNLIVKADVNGSLEALTESLKKLERDEVKLAFVHRGVGGITANDIQLAAASNASIIGFNVRPERSAREQADHEGVEIRTYEVIYNVLEDIENAMVGMLEPEFEEIVTGEAEVREIFRIPRVGAIAGCMVTDGVITRNSKVRFLREGTIIWKGEVNSLRRFKEDVKEVASGFECGIGLSDFQDLKEGDIIETYEEREIPRG